MILLLALILLSLVFIVFLGIVISILIRGMDRASSGARRPTFRESFLNVVPRPAKLIATALLCIAVTVGGIAGGFAVRGPDGLHSPIVGALVGLLGGTFVGGLFLIWILSLGYVYADAQRRNMPAVPWLLVAFFVPNLLGFLLYFVLRKPIASPCPHCGQPIAPDQRFCPSCGQQTFAPPAPTPPPQPI